MKNKTALITGASHGIGKAIALKLASEGYSLSICCKNDITQLNKVKSLCEANNVKCFASLCDVSDSRSVCTFIKNSKEVLGTISTLINNAGISYVGLLTDMTDEDWHETIETNLSSIFYTCRELLPDMIHYKYGRITNISSIWGNNGASTEVAYSASKGGINSFTKALAKETAPSGIAVNAISCGFVDTRMNQHLSSDEISTIVESIPSGKIISPSEVADVCFSVMNQSLNLTGQIITIDGGWI